MWDDEESGIPWWSLGGGSVDESGPGGSYVFDENTFDYLPQADYSNEGLNYPTPESTQGVGGSPINATTVLGASDIISLLQKYGSKAFDFLKANPGLLAGGAGALLGALSKAPPSGGGVAKAYAGPAQQLTRTVTQGKYGPIAQYGVQAARGGIMQAYAQGGAVPIRTGNQLMEDGGFVMTKRAVDGAGGPQGIRQVLPRAQLFQGPGDGSGRDDRIKTGIRAADGGVTPALVSKKEMYVPRQDVADAGGPRKVHALMKRLERRA